MNKRNKRNRTPVATRARVQSRGRIKRERVTDQEQEHRFKRKGNKRKGRTKERIKRKRRGYEKQEQI